MPRSSFGGRHELGQNFLIHQPTISRFVRLVAQTSGSILELGAGDGALTRPVAALGRPLTAIDLDEHKVKRLAQALPAVRVKHADALTYPLRDPAVIGNIPFHLTTPILRRLLGTGSWMQAVLLTQWEVARKRAGVGRSTMMTAQSAPWFTFELHARVPAHGFSPRPGVDGGILTVVRRPIPLVRRRDRSAYEKFVRAVFTGRGGTLDRILGHAVRIRVDDARDALRAAEVDIRALPRDLCPEAWATLWAETSARTVERGRQAARLKPGPER